MENMTDMMGDFTLVLGDARTVDNPSELTQKMGEFLHQKSQNTPAILSFSGFQTLISSGVLTKIPHENDPFLYHNDTELNRPDSELRLLYPTRNPTKTRELRRQFLVTFARQTALKTIAYEKEILTFARALVQDRTPVYSDYVAYLAQFHQNDLQAFFRPWALPVASSDLKAHAYIAAGSGHGKSELLKTMMYGLLKKQQGVILFDPHGDIANQVVRWKEFSKHPERLIYFSPKLAGDTLSLVPVINPMTTLYNHRNGDIDNAVENFIKVLDSVVGGDTEVSFRMKNLLKVCLYTLAGEPNATIYDIIDFLGESDKDDKGNLQPTPWFDKARKTLKNRALQDTLNSFFAKTYDTTKTAVRDRLRMFLSSDALDRCLAGETTIDLARAMNEGKFIVFNLEHGKLGEETSAMFGRFLLGAIQNVAMQRQSQHADERRPVFMFLDEGDRFISESVESIYKETRKYGLHLILAQQVAGANMSTSIQDAVFTNSRVRIVGNGGGSDKNTRTLAELVDVDKAEIKSLKPRTFYAKRTTTTPAVSFVVPDVLVGSRNAMSAEEWQAVKAYQLDHYYRPFDASGMSHHGQHNYQDKPKDQNHIDQPHTVPKNQNNDPHAHKPPINFI
jgi:hypothetical protein